MKNLNLKSHNEINYLEDKNLDKEIKQEKLNKCRNFISFEERLNEMKEFVKLNRRYPKCEEESLGKWRSNIRCNSTESQRKAILDVFPDFFDKKNTPSFEERLNEMKEFVKLNGRYPKREECDLGLWRAIMKRRASNLQHDIILKVFPDFFDKEDSFNKKLNEMKEFVRVNGRYPRFNECSLGRWRGSIRRNSTELQRKAILDVFPDFFDKEDPINDKLEEMKEFVRINGRYPKQSEGDLGKWRSTMRYKCTEFQRKEILKVFPDFFDKNTQSFNKRLNEMKEFVRVNGRYPRQREGSLGSWRSIMRSKSTKTQREAILEVFPDFFD